MIAEIQQALGGPLLDWLQHYWGPVVLVIVAAIYLFGRNWLGDWFDGSTGGE